ncbi:MAG TPA: ubiquitin-conjugating enzyme E2 [Methanomassiliicoccales archaeon]|nr:ubiquitin-conjugating enzyme E2 [Methanomassiliicoccales archaeon]
MPLPPEVLTARVRNELAICQRSTRHPIELGAGTRLEFPLRIDVNLQQIPAHEWRGGEVQRRFNHKFVMKITPDYPFEKPQVQWATPIFHPNIMMPEDGGLLCNKLLEEWNFNSTILLFIKGIEFLLLNPNPLSPFGTESCTAAAQYFNTHKTRHLPTMKAPPPKVVSGN